MHAKRQRTSPSSLSSTVVALLIVLPCLTSAPLSAQTSREDHAVELMADVWGFTIMPLAARISSRNRVAYRLEGGLRYLYKETIGLEVQHGVDSRYNIDPRSSMRTRSHESQGSRIGLVAFKKYDDDISIGLGLSYMTGAFTLSDSYIFPQTAGSASGVISQASVSDYHGGRGSIIVRCTFTEHLLAEGALSLTMVDLPSDRNVLWGNYVPMGTTSLVESRQWSFSTGRVISVIWRL